MDLKNQPQIGTSNQQPAKKIAKKQLSPNPKVFAILLEFKCCDHLYNDNLYVHCMGMKNELSFMYSGGQNMAIFQFFLTSRLENSIEVNFFLSSYTKNLTFMIFDHNLLKISVKIDEIPL